MPPAQLNRKTLLKLLQENNGKLGNLNARRLLGQRIGNEVTVEQYEQLKEQLLSEALIRRAPGRGGAIELIPADPVESGAYPFRGRDSTAQRHSPLSP